MTAAEAKNLRSLKGKRVRIEWKNPNDDWPYFRLVSIDARDSTIKLRGISYMDGGHLCRHDGDEFWADWSSVRSIEAADDNAR